MEKPQISLTSLVLLGGAAPIWLFLIVVVPQSSGWGASPSRFFAAPLVLAGITVAIHRLLWHRREGWALSALLAALIALGSLRVAFWVSS